MSKDPRKISSMHVPRLPYPLLLSLVCFTAAFGDKTEEACPDGKKHYRVTLRHIESGGVGYDDGYTTLETFLAPDPSQWGMTPFFDARAHVFDNGRWAANAGIGLRGILGKRVFGINAYYDYRNTHRLNCNQIGLGLEMLGEILDFRINGYLPLGRKVSGSYDAIFGEFSGNYLLLSQKYELAMKGADAELGCHFRRTEDFDFYPAIVPYSYIGQFGPNTWGGRARLAGAYKEIVSLEISDSYDRTFHNNFQGQISLNFSFGPKSKVEKKRSVD